jgi:hypothetical protein
MQDYIRRVKPAYIKVMEGATDEPYWEMWDWCNQNGILVTGRKYIEDQPHTARNPDPFADQIIDLVRRGCPVRTWGGLNEYYCGGRVEDMERLARFDLRMAQRLNDARINYMAWNGYENAMRWDGQNWVNHGFHLPLVQEALRAAQYIEFHQYWHHPVDTILDHPKGELLNGKEVWRDGPWGEATWWQMRYRIWHWILASIDPELAKPLFNTETGIETYRKDGNEPPYGGNSHGGFGSYTSVWDYARQAQRIDSEQWMKDPKLLGCAFFAWGTNNDPRWNSYDQERAFWELSADHIISAREEEENGPVPSWMIDMQGALPIHPSKRYPYRPVAGIENIVVHHVGMEFDPVAPNVQEVARRTAAYHINHKDWPGIAYTYVISKSGDVAKCWPHNVHTYHVRGHNPESIGILLEGALHLNDPTSEQVASLWQLAEWLRGELGLERIQCPGFQWFDGWQEAYLGDTQSELDRLRALVVERDHQITDMRETMEQARLLLERWG